MKKLLLGLLVVASAVQANANALQERLTQCAERLMEKPDAHKFFAIGLKARNTELAILRQVFAESAERYKAFDNKEHDESLELFKQQITKTRELAQQDLSTYVTKSTFTPEQLTFIRDFCASCTEQPTEQNKAIASSMAQLTMSYCAAYQQAFEQEFAPEIAAGIVGEGKMPFRMDKGIQDRDAWNERNGETRYVTMLQALVKQLNETSLAQWSPVLDQIEQLPTMQDVIKVAILATSMIAEQFGAQSQIAGHFAFGQEQVALLNNTIIDSINQRLQTK